MDYGWQCNECGRLMTLAQAERAFVEGCECGSTDVDIEPYTEDYCPHGTSIVFCNQCHGVYDEPQEEQAPDAHLEDDYECRVSGTDQDY